MRRLLLLIPGLLLCLAVAPAWAEEVEYEYECVSIVLQATRGQIFHGDVVPVDEDSDTDGDRIFVDEAEIIRPATPGFFGNPVQILAMGSGPATSAMPFGISTFPTSDNAVEAYLRVEYSVVGEACPRDIEGLFCFLERLIPPAHVGFRLGSDNMVNDGSNTAVPVECRFDGIDLVRQP